MRAADLRAAPVGMTGQTEASTPSPIITCGQITGQSAAAAVFPGIAHGATLPAEGRRGCGRRDGLD